MIDFLFFLPIIVLIAYVVYQMFKLVYHRYFRSYDKEISDFIKQKGLVVKEVIYPNNKDWKNSPFNKPGSSLSFVFFNFLGFINSWTKREHRLIYAQTAENKERLYWVEIETSFFCKPAIQFKAGTIRKEKLKL